MLQKDPEDRPSATECLKHKWFTLFQLAGDAEHDNNLGLLTRQSSILKRASSNLLFRESLK